MPYGRVPNGIHHEHGGDLSGHTAKRGVSCVRNACVLADELFKRDRRDRIRLRWESFAYLRPEGTNLLYEEKSDIEIRLDECDLLGHDGLLWVLSAIRYREANQLGATYVRLPNRDRAPALSFLEDLGFPDHVLMSGGFFTNEYVLSMHDSSPRRRRRASVQPLSPRYIQYVEHTSWSRVVTALNRYFDEDLMARLDEDGSLSELSEASFPYRETMGELIVNVVLHGGALRGLGAGYACYRMFPPTYPVVRFCCNDLGPGFRTTLEGNNVGLSLEDELSAVKYGLLYRFYNPRDGVVGLYKSLPFVRMLSGKIMIRSQDALLRLDLSNKKKAADFDDGFKTPSLDWIASLVDAYRVPWIPGCHVALDLSLPTQGYRGGSRR